MLALSTEAVLVHRIQGFERSTIHKIPQDDYQRVKENLQRGWVSSGAPPTGYPRAVGAGRQCPDRASLCWREGEGSEGGPGPGSCWADLRFVRHWAGGLPSTSLTESESKKTYEAYRLTRTDTYTGIRTQIHAEIHTL